MLAKKRNVGTKLRIDADLIRKASEEVLIVCLVQKIPNQAQQSHKQGNPQKKK